MRWPVLLVVALFAPLAHAAPEQIHLGLSTADPSTSVSVLWTDLQAETDATLIVDTPAGPLRVPAHEVGGPGLGHQYEANVSNLTPATAYPYHIGEAAFRFTTAPSNAGSTFRFVALGDMGTGAAAAATERAIESLQPAFVLHSGDISYAEGRQNEWNDWFRLVEPVAAKVPWLTALGNHETYTGSSLVELAPAFGGEDARVVSPVELAFYHQRFALPGNELSYSFDWGGAHFVALDTFSAARIPQDEIAWLDADLAAHANASWTIVFLHEPPYSSGTTHGDSLRVQRAFVPIFEKHRVDLVIAGHEHNYERMLPLRDGSVVPLETRAIPKGSATQYVVSGGGGEGTYPFGPAKPITGTRVQAYHVLTLDVTAEQIVGSYVGTDGTPFTDRFVIQRPAPTEAPPASGTAEKTPFPGFGLLLAAGIGTALVARRAKR